MAGVGSSGARSAFVWTGITDAWTSGGWAAEEAGSDGASPMRGTSGRSRRSAGLVSAGGADGKDGSGISNALGSGLLVGAAGTAEAPLAGIAGVASRACVGGKGASDASGIAWKG